jgi:hypothetical protein
MKLRLGRKPRFSIEDIEREAAVEIERRVAMGRPAPEEWKGLTDYEPVELRIRPDVAEPVAPGETGEPAAAPEGREPRPVPAKPRATTAAKSATAAPKKAPAPKKAAAKKAATPKAPKTPKEATAGRAAVRRTS